MVLTSWLRVLFRNQFLRARSRRGSQPRRSRRVAAEVLESRRLLSFTLVGGVRTGPEGLVDVSSDLTLTFSEPVQLGSTGAIRLYGESGRLVESFGATASPFLHASGSTLTIDPTWDLNGGSLYYLTMDAGSVASLDGTPFAGVSDTSTLQFGTDVETGATFGPSSMEDQFPGTASESIGDHRALYMRVTYPDVHRSPNSLSEAEADMTTSSLAWIRNSRGVASLSTTYTPLITLPFTNAWLNQFDTAPGQDGLSMIQNAALNEAAKMGFDPADYNVRIVRVDMPLRSGASWGGGDSVWVSWGGYQVLVHEAGHAVGQGHATSITWSGTKTEYGNNLDWMGSGYDLFDVFGVNSQVALKWVDDTDLLQNPGAGVYRLFGVDSGRQVVGQTYGLRQVVPQDDLMGILNETTSPTYTLEFRPLQPGQLQQSAVLLRNNRVIDLTSQTAGDFQDGGIRAGQTFQIPGSQSYFTVLAQQADHLDVAYQQGPFPDNVAPSVVLSASATTVQRFGEVTFSADVLDVNGDQVVYDWTFGDGVTGSGKSFTRMFRQSTAQDVPVTLTVSDMRGGVTKVTTTVSAGAATTGTPVTLGSHSPPTYSLPRVALVASDGIGGEGGDAASLTVTRLGTALDEPLVVQLEYGGTANTAADFTSLPTTVTIPAGASFVTLALTPVDDATIEPTEKLSVALVASTEYTISSQNGSASLTLSDDDTPVVTIEAVDAAASEPTAEGRDTGLVLIRRTGPTTNPLTVYYGVTGTAANGADFGRLNGQVVIPAGQSSATVMVNPIDDGRGEEDETVDLTLASFNDAYSVGPQGNATVTIRDNADRPVVSLRASGSRATEGEAGKVTFNVVGGDGRELTLQYTVSGTATNGTDYQTLSGTVVVPAGGTNRTVDVAIQSLFDTVAEYDESVILTLTPNGTYQAGLEPTAEVALADVIDTATGGDRVWLSRDFPGKQTAGLEDAAENGQVPLRYFLYRDNATASRQALNVTFSLTGTATPGTDYTGVLRGLDRALLGTFTPAASNTITIPATAKGVLVELVPVIDNMFEGTETIGLQLESVSGSNPFYPIAIRGSDSSRLLDKDPGTVLVGFTSILSLWSEADGGEEGVHLLPVQLSQASAETVTVDYRAAAGSALAFDSDWVFLDPEHGNTPVMNGTLTFAPGETVKNLPIRLRSDRIVESQERFQVVLERPVGASLRSGLNQQTITVYDVIPTGLFREERWAGGTSYNNNSWNTETATYAGYLSGLTTAQWVGDDYSRRITGTMTVPTTGNYRFYLAGDDSARLYLSTSGSSSLKTQIASLNSWTNFQQWDKYASQQSATFSLQAGQTIYLEAQQREDYGGDHLSVGWTGPGFSTITPISTASPLVSVDNRYVRFLQESTTLEEGRTGEIVIGLDRVNLTVPVTVEVQLVAGGTATSGTDFLLGSQSVTFAPGEVSKVVSVAALADSLNESVERVWLRLANAQGAQILSPSDLQLVVLDAPAPRLSTRPGFVERTAATGAAVTQVGATLSPGRTLQSWEILSGNPRVEGSATPAFDIDGEGRITVANPTALPLGSYQVQLTIRATDNAGSSSLAAVPVVVNGERILDEIWGGTEGYLTNDWDQPAKSHSYLTSFDSQRDVGDYYSRRITGVFTPPTTGDYSFWIAARDQGRLTIAPWEDPTNERDIATSPDASYLAWDTSYTQQSPPQSLVAGQRYILRAYQIDWNYSDHLSVAWSGPGIARQVIPGTAFLPTHPRLVLDAPLPSETLPGSVATASLSGTAITDTGIVPTITAGQVTRDATLGLSGTAVAGGEVWLYDGLVFLGKTTATREGTWSLTTPVLEEGLHSFRVEVMDGWGNITRTADVVFEVRSKIVINNTQLLSQAWGGAAATATGQPIDQIAGLAGADQGTVVTQVLADALFVEQRWAGSNVFNSGTWNSVTPTYTGTLSTLATAENVGNDYSRRITGTITPAVTGDYVFYLASDDQGRLYLSSNDTEAGKSLIASVSGWTNFQEWNKYASQRSIPIRLQAGQRYYIEAQQLEASGGDHVSVGWTGPGITQITPISLVSNLVLADGTDGSVSLVTRGTTAVGVPAGVSTTYGGLSPDGAHVVFGSNHVTAFGPLGSPFTDTNPRQSGPYTDLFVFDKSTGAVRLVTSGSTTNSSRSRQAQFVGVTADNQYVIYTSDYVENIGTFTSPDKVVPTTWALVDGGYPTPTGKIKSTAMRVADLDPTTLFYSLNGSWIGNKNFPATVSTPTLARSAGQLSFWVQGQDGVNGAAKAVKLEISDLPEGLLVKATAAKYLSTYQANYDWNNGGTSADIATSANSSGYGVSVLEARGAAMTEAMRVEGIPPSKDLIAFHLPTGTSRLLSHSPALGHDQSAVANVGNVTLSPDGQWVLFTAADASRLGNQGTSFTDTSPGTTDLFAANLQTGEIRLLSHSSGSATASAGAVITLLGLSADGTAAVFQSPDASLFGFTDSAPGANDLFSVNLASGTIQLVSRASASLTTTSAGVATTFQKLLGSHVYFTAGNATAFGFSSDGNTSNADLFRYNLNTGTVQLLSHTTTSVDAALNAGYQSGSVTASADGRFVVFSMDLPASYGGFTASITGTALFITDTTTGAIRLLNASNAAGTNLWYAAWGGVASNPRFFTADSRSLVWQTGGYLASMYSDLTGYGTGSDGQYTPAAMLFDLSQGVLPAGISQTNRLLSHAPAGVTVAGPSITLMGVSRDNRLAYFSAPDASRFGNSGTAFVDSATAATDLFAVDLQTRRLELISGQSGVSYGQVATWQGLTDGGGVVFSVGNVAGITTAAGALTDANGAGTDLLVKRFNLLDLATNDDTQTNGNRTDNITARQNFVLNSLTTPGVAVQLLDNGTMVAEQTPGASGLLRWSLTNVSSGSHTYTLWSPAEQIPVQIVSPLGTSSLTLTVIVVDRPPTDLTLSAASVPENSAENTEVGTLAAIDPNPGDTFTYSLVSGTGSTDNDRFAIAGNRLLARSAFDFEAAHTYSIRVRVSDATNLTFEKVFTITVTDVNEAPVGMALSQTGVAENQPSGTAIGTFSTTDPDAGNTFTYTLVSGTGDVDNARFSIEGGSLKTAAAFDFEAQNSYSIRVRTTDQGGLTFEKVFTISVIDQNESPTNLALSASSVAENVAVGTAVGTFSTTDPDAGNTFTYTLVSGAGDTGNASFAIAGTTLQTTAGFDFEAQSTYSIRVRTTDQGGLSYDKVFAISVTDLLELEAGANQNAFEGDLFSLASSTYNGPWSVEQLTLTIAWGDGTSESGVLVPAAGTNGGTIANTHRYADNGTYTVTLTLTDGTTTVTDSFTASVANAAPAVGMISGLAAAVRGQVVTTSLPFSDAGKNDTHTASITWGDGTSSTGTLTAAAGVGTVSGAHVYTASGTYTVTITVTDDDGSSTSQTKSVSIVAANLQASELDPTQTDLFVGGTTGNDTIALALSGTNTTVTINAVSAGFFAPTGRIVVFGQAGNDNVSVASTITRNAWLYGDDGNDTLTGGGGNDVITGGAGTDSQVGGAGNDLYLFDADLALGIDTVNDSAGIDTLDFSATSSQAIALNLALNTTQVVNANLTLTLTSGSAIETLTGGSQNDTLTGNSLANLLVGGPGNDTLTGAAGNDVYRFDLDDNLGADTLNEAGGGTDVLDFTPTTSLGATVDLSLATVQTVALGRLTLVLGSATTFENITGGGGNDSLTGNTLANVLTGGAGDDTLAGSTGNDTYLFDADSPLGIDTLVETATGGTDLVDFTGTSAGVTLDVSLATTQVVNANLSLNLQTGTVFENATGGDGADLLFGNSLINTLTGGSGNDSLNGAGNNDVLVGGLGDDTLAGGAGNDSYVYNAGSALGSDTLVELAGEGSDLITFATTTTKGVAVNLGLTTVQTAVVGNLNLTLNAADTFENVTGGSLADTLTGNTLGNVLIGGPGNDTLAGAAGDDVYSYTTSSALGTDSLFELVGEGADTLDFSLTTTLAVTVNLALATTQVVNANLSLVLNAGEAFENATGGSLNDTLTGNALANRLVGNAGLDTLAGGVGNDTLDGGLGNDNLQGGADNDTYPLDADLVLGTEAITELAGGGIDTLDFSQTTTKTIAVNLGLTSPQTVTASNLTLMLNAADTFENVLGGALNDVLTGNSLANRLVGAAGLDTLQGLTGDDTLVGGAGNDSFVFNTVTALGTDTLDESAGGLDTLDFSASTTWGVTVNLGTATTQVVNANLSLILGADNTFENVLGTTLNDTLIGNALANTLSGNAGSDTLTGGVGNDTLIGGLGDDTYLFAANSPLGTDTLNESAGGLDTLDFSGTTSTNVTLNLGTTTSQVVNANLSLVLGLATAFENSIGGGGNDLLTGNTLGNLLAGGAGNDTLVGLAGNDTLQGGQGDDSYVFAANAALGADSVVELAGEGLDLLDLSTTTLAVTVNLGLTTTQVVNANLSLTLNAADTFEMLIGSSLNDTLTGNSLANVIFGGAGNDTMVGLAGRDLLFGGNGNDSLNGGDDEDVVSGGLTTYFSESTKVLDRTAIKAIRDDWTRLDLAYANRITNLKNGGGLNGTYRLSTLTVLTDSAAMVDTLTGGLSLDWFWQFTGDVVSDLNTGGTETVN